MSQKIVFSVICAFFMPPILMPGKHRQTSLLGSSEFYAPLPNQALAEKSWQLIYYLKFYLNTNFNFFFWGSYALDENFRGVKYSRLSPTGFLGLIQIQYIFSDKNLLIWVPVFQWKCLLIIQQEEFNYFLKVFYEIPSRVIMRYFWNYFVSILYGHQWVNCWLGNRALMGNWLISLENDLSVYRFQAQGSLTGGTSISLGMSRNFQCISLKKLNVRKASFEGWFWRLPQNLRRNRVLKITDMSNKKEIVMKDKIGIW